MEKDGAATLFFGGVSEGGGAKGGGGTTAEKLVIQVFSCNREDVRLPTGLFYIERDPHSRTEIGERDTQVVRVNEATVA